MRVVQLMPASKLKETETSTPQGMSTCPQDQNQARLLGSHTAEKFCYSDSAPLRCSRSEQKLMSTYYVKLP